MIAAAATGIYDAAYHEGLRAEARAAALRVLPSLLARVPARRLVDFGCGTGEWLAVAGALGVEELCGVDGPWVTCERLASDLPTLPRFRFVQADLRAPLDLDARFDLALCLEVAEHLPAEAGEFLVDTLTRHASAIAFSAATPGQGGEGHVNEAWPSRWRALFEALDFVALDVLRGPLWGDDAIPLWYRQNLVLYVARERLAADPELGAGAAGPFDVVHPELFVRKNAEAEAWARAWTGTVAALEAERVARAEERDAAAAALSGAERRLDAVHGALSWRATAPLRRLAAAIRRFGGQDPR